MTRDRVKEIISESQEFDYDVLKFFYMDFFDVNATTKSIITNIIEEHEETTQEFENFMLDDIAAVYTEDEFRTRWEDWQCD